jgi:2-methylaconitate cis-trans-isomerase PrpF
MAYIPQIRVKATYMRGGTSKGTFFNIADLPKEAQEDKVKRDKLLQRIVGSPDIYKQQMDGMGGATSSTSLRKGVKRAPTAVHKISASAMRALIS